MTDDELQAIEVRANAATPGPWHLAITANDDPEYANIEAGSIDIADDVENRNAIFIYHARTDVPALVAEVRRLRVGDVPLAAHAISELNAAHKTLDELGAPTTQTVMRREGDGTQEITIGIRDRILRLVDWLGE